MSSRPRRARRVRGRWLAALVLVLLIVAPLPAEAFTWFGKINTPGFGDSQNSYAWAMAWFNGKLYVGTARSEMCVEYATYAFYNITSYKTNPAPGVICPANPYDLNLRAEIWQYTPQTNTWLRVYQSPVIPNPADPTKTIAQDIAYRGMVVYQNQLYVLGVTADEYIPALKTINPPRILRTADGIHFTALNLPVYQITYPNSQQNWQPTPFYPMGYRSYAVYNNRLFVTATPSLTGDGALMELTNPAGANPTITQVSPDNMQIFEINPFNNQLYIGGADPTTGYFVDRTSATGAPFTYTPVMGDGAGRGKAINSVVSMFTFNNRLYVGASGWYQGFAASEMIRVNPDNTWQLIVGNPRMTSQGYMTPISGLPDGFGNPFNAHFWRMQSFDGALYVGTNDTTWLLYGNPLANLFLWWQYGFDLYYTCNGNTWYTATLNAFGNGPYNFGVRNMAASAVAGYLGSANQAQGTVVWSSSIPLCGFSAGGVSTATTPGTVQATVVPGGVAVTWDAVPGAVSYHILRSDFVSNQALRLVSAQPAPQMFGDLSVPPISPTAPGPPANLWIPGPYHEVGQTTGTMFLDRTARPGGHYAYEVEAQFADGTLSSVSTTAYVPALDQPATFSSVTNTVVQQESHGVLSSGAAASLLSNLDQAQSAAQGRNSAAAVQRLNSLQSALAQNTVQAGDVQSRLDLQTLLDQLQQRLRLYESGLLSGNPGQ